MPVEEATIEKLPRVACIGTVTEVEDASLTNSEKYQKLPIRFTGIQNGLDMTLYFLFRTEWFQGSGSGGLDKSSKAVYKNHMRNSRGNANLQRLLGEKFGQVIEEIDSVAAKTDLTPILIGKVIAKHTVGQRFLYSLQQQTTKLDDGSRALEDRYEFRSFELATADALKRTLTFVAKTEETDNPVMLTFETGEKAA